MKRFAPLLLVLLAACQDDPVPAPVDTAPCELSGYTSVTVDHRGVDSLRVWDAYIKFHTTECASDVSVKVYIIYPGEPRPEPEQGFLDGARQLIGVADAPALPVDPDYPWFGTPHTAVVQLPPYLVAYPDGWDTKLWVEVRSGWALVGAFRTVDDGTPD